MKEIIPLLLFLILISCKKDVADENNIVVTIETNREYVNEQDFFDDQNKSDTIYFDAEIDDCGEWGGPRENIKIYSNYKNEKILNYKKFKFNCDSTGYYYNLKNPELDFEKELVINQLEKNLIKKLFQDLMAAKINQKWISNAGSVYKLRSSDSTLYINILTDKTDFNEKYIEFKNELKLTK